MANFKEIVTKAVIGKAKKTFTTESSVTLSNTPTTVLGCWVINHNFQGSKVDDKIVMDGSYDVNIWYSYDHDSKTEVVKDTNTYHEIVSVRRKDDDMVQGEEIIVRSLKQPSCTRAEIEGNKISYTIEKELGVELVGDTKVKIAIDENEDPWDEIGLEEDVNQEIEDAVREDYIEEQANDKTPNSENNM